ncbi:MAG: spore coat protein [Clostridia bacterium]|nr:spore coat protein [Clostridia bacterium]
MNNSQTMVYSDQDRMEDLLSQEKYLIDGYSTFIPEADCPELRQVLTENMNGCFGSQYAVFDQMRTLGWYPSKPAPQADIDEARQKSEQLRNQLG